MSKSRLRNSALTLTALGVVFGDIGTSPLYALNEIFFAHGRVSPTEANIIGCLSLVIWALASIVAFKYLIFVLQADNDGEGGVFALYALLHQHRRRGLHIVLLLIVLAAGLLFGDGIITPAISVLSSVEGLAVATPSLAPFIIPLTIMLLTLLFAVQRHGTDKVGSIFGPVTLVWFIAIASLGAVQLVHYPRILLAFDPLPGILFLKARGWHAAMIVLGGVMLVVTGGEALYADMGHFGKGPIRLGWFAVVFPALLLNYLGQGAYLLRGGVVVQDNLFYSMVPKPLLFPMILLAAAATVIASQALISGVFSLFAQATALGLFPRLNVVHTHEERSGQIYSPFVNWALFLGCVLLVLGFTKSMALASAYGLAVSGNMLVTSLSMLAVAHLCWKWNGVRAASLFGWFVLVDATFLGANSLKLIDGGYIPLTIGAFLFFLMTTWRWGRRATEEAYSHVQSITMQELIRLKEGASHFLERNAIFMVPKPVRFIDEKTPALFQLFWSRYNLLPKNLLFVDVVQRKLPYIHKDRYEITTFQKSADRGSIASVTVQFGFMETPDVEEILEDLADHHEIRLPKDPHTWMVHATHENIIPAPDLSGFDRFRFRLFSTLRQISRPAYYYYGMGNKVQLSVEILPVRLQRSLSK